MKTTTDNETSPKNTPDNSTAVSEGQQSDYAANSAVGSMLAELTANWHFEPVENDPLLHLDVGGELIFDYTRAQAIADRVLVDVSPLARDAGFTEPVAITEWAWETCVQVSDGLEGQDEAGRLRDLLNVLQLAKESGISPQGNIRFTVAVRQTNEIVANVSMKAHCHSGDNGEPVITVLLPCEDVLYRMQAVDPATPKDLPPDDK